MLTLSYEQGQSIGGVLKMFQLYHDSHLTQRILASYKFLLHDKRKSAVSSIRLICVAGYYVR